MSEIVQDRRPGVLEQYARLKLELAAIIRAILHIAEKRRDELTIRECRRLLARVAEDRFNLAVLGQFSRGKSSLMNALLGAAKLPTGVLPLTSVITTVTYGESERVLLQREDWSLPQEIPLSRLSEFVTQQGNPGNEKRVTLAEVQLPNELLRLGVHFADTPGIASAIAANTRTTRQFLPEADAAIFVTSFESPMTETEVNFLREIREHVRKVFVVVNKLDLISSAESAAALNSVREIVYATLQENDIEIFAVSAREALRAKLEGSPETLIHSGLPVLESALTDFLRRDKARELLLRAAERIAGVAHQEELAIRISQRALSPAEAGQFEQRLTERISSFTGEREALIRRLHHQLRSEFPDKCQKTIGLWSDEAEVLLISELRDWLSREQRDLGGSALEKFLHDLFQRLFSLWFDRNRDQINSLFQQSAQQDSGDVGALTAKISMAPLDVLGGANEGEDRVPVSDLIVIDALTFRAIDVQIKPLREPLWFDLLPTGRMRGFLAQRWLKRVPELIRIYQRAAFSLIESAVDDWVRRLDWQLSNRIENMRAHISGLLHRQPETTDLPEIENALERIQGLVKAVLTMAPEDSESSSPVVLVDAPRQRPASFGPCPICVRIERALFDFMAQRQYDLSLNENEQRRHALRSGFCPLHTWQFEAIASPQGVCSAYPELMILLAKHLRSLAENSSPVESTANGVQALLPNKTRCTACRLVKAIERAAAHELAIQLGKDDTMKAGVCIVHLYSVLSAGVDRTTTMRLLLEEAIAFQSLAEDMQNYVLKHDAVRHYLSTNAEREAALSGLARLVGRRNVVAPWRTE